MNPTKYFATPASQVLEGVVEAAKPFGDITAPLPLQLAGPVSRLNRKASRRWGTIRAARRAGRGSFTAPLRRSQTRLCGGSKFDLTVRR